MSRCKDHDGSGLAGKLDQFEHEHGAKVLEDFVKDTGDGESLAAKILTWSSDGGHWIDCSCMDAFRKYDGGRLYRLVKDDHVSLYTGGPKDITLHQLAKALGVNKCMSDDTMRGGARTHRTRRRRSRGRKKSRKSRTRRSRRKH